MCTEIEFEKPQSSFCLFLLFLLSAKEKLLNAYQSLYAAIVIGNAFHIGRILPVGDALLVKGAAAQDKPCVRTHATSLI